MSWLPRQNDYRTFCMSDETEKVYQKLEEVVGYLLLEKFYLKDYFMLIVYYLFGIYKNKGQIKRRGAPLLYQERVRLSITYKYKSSNYLFRKTNAINILFSF